MNFILFVPFLFAMEFFGPLPSSINSRQTFLSLQNQTKLLQQTSSLISSSPSSPLSSPPPSTKPDPLNQAVFDEYFDDPEQYFDEDDVEENRIFKKSSQELTTEARRAFIEQMTVQLLRNQTASLDISSMTTLWVMTKKSSTNDQAHPVLQKSFLQGRRSIEANQFELEQERVESIISKYIGSLLSLFALTRDQMYLKKAQKLFVSKVQPRFENQKTLLRDYLELNVFTELTASKLSLSLEKISPPVDLESIKTVGLLRAKEQLMAIVKSSALKKESNSLDLFKFALDYFESTENTFQSSDNVCVNSTELGVSFCRPGQVTVPGMTIKDCDLGAMFALAAEQLLEQQRSKVNKRSKRKEGSFAVQRGELARISRYWERAEQLTEGCRRMVTKFGSLNESSQLAESYFTFWRLTHQLKYRDYAWELAQALSSSKVQNLEILSKTLKYLYLIFSPDHLLPLEEWTFNSEGQPFPRKLSYSGKGKL